LNNYVPNLLTECAISHHQGISGRKLFTLWREAANDFMCFDVITNVRYLLFIFCIVLTFQET